MKKKWGGDNKEKVYRTPFSRDVYLELKATKPDGMSLRLFLDQIILQGLAHYHQEGLLFRTAQPPKSPGPEPVEEEVEYISDEELSSFLED